MNTLVPFNRWVVLVVGDEKQKKGERLAFVDWKAIQNAEINSQKKRGQLEWSVKNILSQMYE